MKTLFLSLLLCSQFANAFLANAFPKTSYQKFPVPKKGGTFNDVILTNPLTLNPILIQTLDDRELSEWIYMPLLGRDADTYEHYGMVAEKVESSKDRKDYTFTLNSKAKWADGTAVTSDDMEFTFQKIMDPKVEAGALRSFFGGVTFQKIDALHFKFHVDKPRFNTMNMLAGVYPIQKKQFEKEENLNTSKENLHPIGTGPYRVKSISRDQMVVLERNPDWWAKDFPDFRAFYNFDTIQFKVIPDPALRYENFLKGNIDTIVLTPDQYAINVLGIDKDKVGDRANSGKSVWAGKFPTDGTLPWFGLALNQKNPILKSLKVRKALAYLVDYQTVNEKAFFGTVEQCLTPFGTRTKNLDPKVKSMKYTLDPKKAAQLLKEDGWQAGSDNFLHKELDGKDTVFKLQIKYYGANMPMKKMGEIIREQFKRAGIDVELRPTDGAALYKEFDDKNFDAMFMGWGGGSQFPDARQNWHTESINNGSNQISYSNPVVDRLIDQSNLEFDPKKRTKLLQEIGKRLYDDLPYIFLVERGFIIQGLNSKLKSPQWAERYGTSISKSSFYY